MRRGILRPFARAAAVLAACIAWSTPGGVRAAVPAGQPVDGIRCDTIEGSIQHIHQHLAILDHAKPVPIPSDIGRPLIGRCFYWIHTHTPDGIIHIESPAFRTFTLGELFDVWGEQLTRADVAGATPKKGERIVVWIDGRRFAGNPRGIELTNHLDMTIEVGPPYKKPAPFTEWNGN